MYFIVLFIQMTQTNENVFHKNSNISTKLSTRKKKKSMTQNEQ